MRIFDGITELAAAVGDELGVSDWLVIDQERIDTFATATGDQQWIHVDLERAAAGPFGGTIAPGLLTLALLPWFQHQIYRWTACRWRSITARSEGGAVVHLTSEVWAAADRPVLKWQFVALMS